MYACMKCNRQMFPPEIRYSCGICEFHDYCHKCWKSYEDKLDELHRHYLYKDQIFPEVIATSINEAKDLTDCLLRCMKVYNIRFLLGTRKVVKKNNNVEEEFSKDFYWKTYSECLDLSMRFGNGLLSLPHITERDKVGLCGVSSAEWLLSQWGLFFKGFISVPIHASFTPEQIAHILKLAEVTVLIISEHILYKALEACHLLKERNTVRHIITMKDNACSYVLRSLKDGDMDWPVPENVVTWSWNDIKEKGKYDEKIYRMKEDDIATLLSTSGSTGMPKLTIMTNQMLTRGIYTGKAATEPMVMYAIEPLRQSLDLLCRGGRIGIYSGRHDKLLEDIQSLRPTVLGATPSFWNNLYSTFQEEASEYLKNNPGKDNLDFLQEFKAKKIFGNRLFIGMSFLHDLSVTCNFLN